MNKYSAKKTIVDGITFHSKRESLRYSTLKLLERAGEIKGLELQPKFPFVIRGKPVLSRSERYPNGRPLKMVADFKYFDVRRKCEVWEDSKGFRTDSFILKKAFFEALNPGVLLEEV